MCAKTRKSERYDVIGKVESDELSAFSGTILNISSQGCRIHYAAPVTVSLENEYTVKIKLFGQTLFDSLTLICQPVWACEDSGSTDIGMKFLHSPDTDSLNKCINLLKEDDKNSGDVKEQIVENECQFI